MILMGPSQFKIFSVSNVCVATEVLTELSDPKIRNFGHSYSRLLKPTQKLLLT